MAFYTGFFHVLFPNEFFQSSLLEWFGNFSCSPLYASSTALLFVQLYVHTSLFTIHILHCHIKNRLARIEYLFIFCEIGHYGLRWFIQNTLADNSFISLPNITLSKHRVITDIRPENDEWNSTTSSPWCRGISAIVRGTRKAVRLVRYGLGILATMEWFFSLQTSNTNNRAQTGKNSTG